MINITLNIGRFSEIQTATLNLEKNMTETRQICDLILRYPKGSTCRATYEPGGVSKYLTNKQVGLKNFSYGDQNLVRINLLHELINNEIVRSQILIRIQFWTF